jgi:neprosin-like protein
MRGHAYPHHRWVCLVRNLVCVVVVAVSADGAWVSSASAESYAEALAASNAAAAARCVPAPPNEPTPPPLPPGAMQDRIDAGTVDLKPVCPANEVVAPLPGYQPKAPPVTASSDVLAAGGPPTPPYYSLSTTCPLYPSEGQYYCHQIEEEEVSATGLWFTASQHRPWLSSSDYHTLVQFWGLASNGSTLESGWTVDPEFGDDTFPRLFIYHFAGNVETCYNACGYQQDPGIGIYPGMPLTPDGRFGTFGVTLSGGNWWFYYGGYYYGYIPQYDSSWGAYPITSFYKIQTGGEVDASSATPCTDMGNGTYGSAGGADISAAWYASGVYLTPSDYLGEGTDGYNEGYFSPSQGAFRYGGPGFC